MVPSNPSYGNVCYSFDRDYCEFLNIFHKVMYYDLNFKLTVINEHEKLLGGNAVYLSRIVLPEWSSREDHGAI